MITEGWGQTSRSKVMGPGTVPVRDSDEHHQAGAVDRAGQACTVEA